MKRGNFTVMLSLFQNKQYIPFVNMIVYLGIPSRIYQLVSGVARTSPMLGHSMGTLRLYELPREVQKLIGGSGGILPPGILQPPRSVLRPYTVAKCKSTTANSRMMRVCDP